LLVACVDLVLGPAMTALVYKPGKRWLWLDISIIVFLQIAALIYGAYVVSAQRPGYLVLVADRIYVVATQDVIGVPSISELSPKARSPLVVRYNSPTFLGGAFPNITNSPGDPPPQALFAADYAPMVIDPAAKGLLYGELATVKLLGDEARIKQALEAINEGQVGYVLIGRKAIGVVILDKGTGQLVDTWL
jgi:hypothetical protein